MVGDAVYCVDQYHSCSVCKLARGAGLSPDLPRGPTARSPDKANAPLLQVYCSPRVLFSFRGSCSFPTPVLLTLWEDGPYFRLPQSPSANEWRYKSLLDTDLSIFRASGHHKAGLPEGGRLWSKPRVLPPHYSPLPMGSHFVSALLGPPGSSTRTAQP